MTTIKEVQELTGGWSFEAERDLGHHPHFSAPLSPHPLKMNKHDDVE
jgi:hypothetical protein